MDLRKLKTLIELVESSGIAELEISEGEERVRITRSLPVPTSVPATTAGATPASPLAPGNGAASAATAPAPVESEVTSPSRPWSDSTVRLAGRQAICRDR
jgi:acetyl-CoA carboxylase biotin carboxyl carrier protein